MDILQEQFAIFENLPLSETEPLTQFSKVQFRAHQLRARRRRVVWGSSGGGIVVVLAIALVSGLLSGRSTGGYPPVRPLGAIAATLATDRQQLAGVPIALTPETSNLWLFTTSGAYTEAVGTGSWLEVFSTSGNESVLGATALSTDDAWLEVLDPSTDRLSVMRTMDGGRVWTSAVVTQAAAPGIARFRGRQTISFADPMHGYLIVPSGSVPVQSASTVFGTSDGGRNWTEENASSPVGDVEAVSGPVLWGSDARYRSTLFESIDGGKQWNEVRVGNVPEGLTPAVSIVFGLPVSLGPGRLVIPVQETAPSSTTSVTIYETVDAGKSWSAVSNPLTYSGSLSPLDSGGSDIFDPLSTVSDQQWFVATNNGVYETTNQGVNWQKVSYLTSNDVSPGLGGPVGIVGVAFASAHDGDVIVENSACTAPGLSNNGFACVAFVSVQETDTGGGSWTTTAYSTTSPSP